MEAQFPEEETKSGEFKRQEDAFREWVSNDGSTAYAAEAGRYHLYVSLACPWASRTVIVRKLKGLEAAIDITVVDPIRDEKGWAFRDPSGDILLGAPFESTDPINGFQFLGEAYKATDLNYCGRVTVPVLWDTKTKRIVNNCEDDICRMFNDVFNDFARNKSVELFPKEIQGDHAKLSDFIYNNINNGVYKAGFATRQRPYEVACRRVFQALDELEQRLSKSRYLFQNRIVEADWRLFCTLVRFDAVYHGHFKCNLRRIVDYPNLQGYLMDLYQHPGIADTVNFDHIKRHYYMTHTAINPTRIVPIGPLLDLTKPHGRERLN
ncbi:MAG TPA: glutathione S-transferase family protein [Candidatus Udaeobacter sp.]|jgi:putative glutathione S-transferase